MKKHSSQDKNMIHSYLGTFNMMALVALLIIVSILVFTGVTKKSADEATTSLSEFYLEEIAERTVYEISEVLKRGTAQSERAIDEMRTEKITSKEELQEYLAFIKELDGLDVFAVVDENGTFYTSDNTFSDEHGFDSLSMPITEPQYFTSHGDGTDTILFAAIPVTEPISIGDIQIIGCLTGMEVDKIISTQQLQGGNNLVLCRVFDGDDGTCIVETDGKYSNGSSIFDVWKDECTFIGDYSYEKLITDWNARKEGFSSYLSPEGITYLYYEPVPGTDWMVSTRLREGVIRNQITRANKKILHSSWGVLAVVILSMSMLLLFSVRQVHKNQKLQFERKREEENLRQEAKVSEERLHLQEKLLEEEKASNRQASVIQALSRQYALVYYVNLMKGTVLPIRLTDFAREHYTLELNQTTPLETFFSEYVQDMPYPEQVEEIQKFANPEFLRQLLKEEEVHTYLYQIIREGRELYAQLRIARVKKDSELHHVVMGFAIVDEEIRAEQEKQRVLKEALAQAESANHAKTAFLNSMSHDIRTPMNAIIGYTDIALKQDVSAELQGWLEKIHESSEHLLTLINDVLDISRIESGKMKLEAVPVDVTTITDTVLDIMNGFLANRNITFCVNRVTPKNPYAIADAVRIREVLVNILSNAVKFTPDGGTITFETLPRPDLDDKHGVMRYRVSDTGIGMSEKFLEHIFDEFAQEEHGARTQYKGTGLGMAITKRYVELMNGTISVESTKGVGTTFTVELPFELTNEAMVRARECPGIDSTLSGMKLLLAEDNALNAEIAEILLTDEGAQITVVEDGQKALEMFEQKPAGTFDAILMDIMMPVMDGITATTKIRALERADAKTIPIIAMTANAFAEDAQKCLEAGMNAHLTKPLQMDTIKRTILEQILKQG